MSSQTPTFSRKHTATTQDIYSAPKSPQRACLGALDTMDLKHIFRGTNISFAYQHCRPNSLVTFWIIWKLSGQSGYFLYGRESFLIACENSVNFPDGPENFWIAWKVSGQNGCFPDGPESFRIIQKVSGWAEKFLDSLKTIYTLCMSQKQFTHTFFCSQNDSFTLFLS